MCNSQESGASRVCITFSQITQKVLTEDITHWLELITEIINFLHIFSLRKATIQLFKYFRISAKKLYFWLFCVFKSKLQINHAATYIELFLPDSNNWFFIYLVPHIHICLYYFLILCFHFHLFGYSSHSETFYNLQRLIRFHHKCKWIRVEPGIK